MGYDCDALWGKKTLGTPWEFVSTIRSNIVHGTFENHLELGEQTREAFHNFSTHPTLSPGHPPPPYLGPVSGSFTSKRIKVLAFFN